MDRENRIARLGQCVVFAGMILGTLGLLFLAGCSSWTTKGKEKDNQFVKDTRRIQEMMLDPDRKRLIGEVVTSLGMKPSEFDAFAIACGLPGTGGIVRPGVQRDLMLDEMRVRETDNPEAFLDDPSTALVKLKTIARPCDNKGDILDVLVECSTECTATSLAEGFVLEARLAEMAMLDKMRKSEPKAIAVGEVVILPTSFTRKPEITPLSGVIIGGAKLKLDMPIGLRIEEEYRHVIVTKAIEKAINSRYFFKDSSKQKMVAEGTSDWFVAIRTVPKYKYDPAHFMSVIKCTGFGETSDEQQERLVGCRKLLANPETSRRAAAELEAIGNDAAKQTLISGLTSSNTEVRFYSAYSLAYLDCKEAVPTLVELAQTTPAARQLCLLALVVNEDSEARVALEQLLQEQDPDLRFGAFNAIRLRNATDMAVKGESIGKNFQFVQVPSSIPLLAVSLQKQKEVILFGNQTAVMLSAPISPTPLLTLAPSAEGQIKMMKRHGTGEVHNAIVGSDIVSVLRGMGKIQCNYNDVVHTLNQLALNQALASPVSMNPLPLQDGMIVDSASEYANRFRDQKELMVNNASVNHTPDSTSRWWSTIGLNKASWFKPKRQSSKDSTESDSKESFLTSQSNSGDASSSLKR